MADSGETTLPQATVLPPRRFRISIVWLVPILAVAAAVSLAFERILREGPTITIVFRAAEGIEAGKTVVKYKDVKIGQVTAVQLTRDYRMVEVRAKIARRVAGLMVDDAEFWIVEPRITPSGVSGLGALLSGNYIGFRPGHSAHKQHHFVALETAPAITDRPGRAFELRAEDLGSLAVGSPLYYRLLTAGVVTGYRLSADGKSVEIDLFVDAPYDRFVTTGTRFWNASGVDVSVGANGVELRTESLSAVLAGGIAFDTPPFMQQAAPAEANVAFELYRDRDHAMKGAEPGARQYVLYFDRPLDGLDAGAPVTLLGLPAGEVTRVDLVLDAATARLRPRAIITFNPTRVIAGAIRQPQEHGEALLRSLVEERGLRAQLKRRNLLLGTQDVDFEMAPSARRVRLDLAQPMPELPVAPSGGGLEAKLGGVAHKLDQLPLASIAGNLDGTLAQARRLIGDVGPEVHAALEEVARAARSLRSLTDYLERHPESLLRGKRGGGGEK